MYIYILYNINKDYVKNKILLVITIIINQLIINKT